MLAPVGILVALSAFIILYKSYQARGYLNFLGAIAKQGTLPEEYLPLVGWPARRIQGWRSKVWPCPWLAKPGDLLEPYMFLPILLVLAWLFVLARHQLKLQGGLLLVLCIVLTALILSVLCVLWVRWERKHEDLPASPGGALSLGAPHKHEGL